MRSLIALILACAPAAAQVARLDFAVEAARPVAPAPFTLRQPYLTGPSLLPSGALPNPLHAPTLQTPAAHFDAAHWAPHAVVDRDYAAILERGVEKVAADSVHPEALETLRRKDGRIYSHMMRVAILAGAIASAMGENAEAVRKIAWAARLHDIGKTEDRILQVVNKEGKLDLEEREIMMTHPQAGVDILFAQTDIPYDLHWPAMRAALAHHEAMDGTGYPQGLKGEQIPLEARITTVADYFDALLENRPYRAALTVSQALEIMQKVKDKFDPRVWEAFLGVVHAQ